jgi:hypothetical protein
LPPGAVTTAFAGGAIFASGALHGKAAADGARPIAPMSPTAAADATVTDTIRIPAMTHLPGAGRRIDVRKLLM